MKLVIFGLTISSSWGNGHATLWRGLCKALARRGVRIVFFEHDQSWYAQHRDWREMPCGDLVIYKDWNTIEQRATAELVDADAAIVTSYCPDALRAQRAIHDAARPLAVFYDLDTPVTLSLLQQGETAAYIGPGGLRDFDLVLSYTGGPALDELRSALGARRVRTLYGHVDPEVHRPADPMSAYSADLSWLGTYGADRRAAMEALFIEPAALRPQKKFLVGGAQYPDDFPWRPNIWFVSHVPPDAHPAFFCSSRVTLNLTREAMARMGWCPSGRLFEAAACGAAIVTDVWPGLDEFYAPDDEVLLARTAEDVVATLDLTTSELQRIARAARERTLAEHTSEHRARLLLRYLHDACSHADDGAARARSHSPAQHAVSKPGVL